MSPAQRAEVESSLESARHLAENGVRLFLARIAEDQGGGWNQQGGSNGCGYVLPRQWQIEAEADPSIVDRWSPGWGLAAVMGDIVDAIDVDPRNGGDASFVGLNGIIPTTYGRQSTPSGGMHLLIASVGVRKVGDLWPGIDLQAGVNGDGLGFIWLAPTIKVSKADGTVKPYRWSQKPDLTALGLLGPDGTGDALRAAVEAKRARRGGAVQATAYDGPEYEDLTVEQKASADAADAALIESLRARLADAVGWDDGYRDPWGMGWELLALNVAWRLACRAAAPWSGMDEFDAATAYDDILPEEFQSATECRGKWRDDIVERASGEQVALPPWEDMPFDAVDEYLVEPVYGAVSGMLMDPDYWPDPWRTGAADNPDVVATDLLKKFWRDEERSLVLRYWLGDTYEWHQSHWARMGHNHLEAVLLRLLGPATYRRDGRQVPWNPAPGKIATVAETLRLKTLVHEMVKANSWLRAPAGEGEVGGSDHPVGFHDQRYISFSNGILDREESRLIGHTPAFFNTWSMRFEYDPEATCPVWDLTMKQWFPEDEESRGVVEEMLGYLLLGGMEYDKIFVLLGPPRSGKSTVMRVLNSMIGPAFTTQSLDDLADRFGLEDLLGKRVCHISEAAATREVRKVVSLMKSVSGQEEGREVKRKGDKSLGGVDLAVRFVLSGNEELTFPDASGTIIDRMIVMWFGQSFLGHENTGLTAALINESPGLFNRLSVAYVRLMERGRFVQPASGQEVKDRLRAAAAPEKVWWQESYEATRQHGDVVRLEDVVQSYISMFSTPGKHITVRQAQMRISALLPPGVAQERTMVDGVRVQILRGVVARPEEGE